MLSVTNLNVMIEDQAVLKDLSLEVPNTHTLGVLGPSGSGKSTLLRSIAGLVEVASGDITWDGKSLLDTPTHQRQLGLMFQGYALFPHLTVAGNVGFGLRMAGHSTAAISEEVSESLGWVGLAGFEDRQVDSLSGGERQRVALARTLAPRPRLVMLDEPLGALDRSLRDKLIDETREILDQRQVTAIFVTHDRDEAARLSDRLALMRNGTIVQTGTLTELQSDPIDDWTRDFLS